MSLLNYGSFYLSSGTSSLLKIDCDFLSDTDIETAASMFWRTLPKFGLVIGVPTGGSRLANAMKKYADPNESYILLCDDVFTTGASMDTYRDALNDPTEVIGAVLFARNPTPQWITPLFTLNPIINHANI